MKIKSIRAVSADFLRPPELDESVSKKTRPSWASSGPVANPMTRYGRYAEFRPLWMPNWENFGCLVEAEDGTWGFAVGNHGKPVATIIDEYLGPRLVGENCMAIEKIYDMMVRMGSPYGATGLHSYAVSAIDLALWDLKGKILDRPVYELLGGPARDELFCYSTGGDTDWYMELGFKATKLPCKYGPADGLDGLKKNVEFIGSTRELIGDDVELMLDCWMGFDIEYAVRLAEELRPFKLKWMEEILPSEDFDAHAELRRRVSWQTLATGEHWYTTVPFQHAASKHLVDIMQPDINWVGGMTAIVKICAIAEAANISVIPHGGGNTPYGQHACFAMPAIPWTECYIATPPGVPIERLGGNKSFPGMSVPKNSKMVPSNAPGFGLEIDKGDLKPYQY
ncbi:MAG: L-rhamnonate dehydratase [Chloroflexi bacterium]|nr:L-rhamnonate dehydratase [Chloroflexota bacterium]